MDEFLGKSGLAELKHQSRRDKLNFFFKVFGAVLFVLGTEFFLYTLIPSRAELKCLDEGASPRIRRNADVPSTTIPGPPGLPSPQGPPGPPGQPGQPDGCQVYRTTTEKVLGVPFRMIWTGTPKKKFSLDFLTVGPASVNIFLARDIGPKIYPIYEIFLEPSQSKLNLRSDIHTVESTNVVLETYEPPKSSIIRMYSITIWDDDHIEIILDGRSALEWEGSHKFDLQYFSFGSWPETLLVYGCKENTLRPVDIDKIRGT